MVVLAIAIGNAGSTLYLPALVTITHKLASTAALVKMSLSCYLLTFGLSQLVYGPLSDACGRRKILISGLVIFLIGSILVSYSTNIYLFLIGRLVEGIGIGAANAVGYALIRDVYTGNDLIRKLSYVSMFVGLTPIIAPLCGGYLVEYFNWQACFLFLSILSFILIITQIIKLPETNVYLNFDAIKPKFIISNYTKLLADRGYLAYILTAGFSFASLLSLNAVLPFIIIKHLDLSPANYGWLALLTSLGYFSGSFVGGLLAVEKGAAYTIKFGLILQAIIAIIAFFSAQYWFNIVSVLLPLAIILFGIGFNLPIAAGGAMALFPQIAGSAAALLGAVMFGVSAIFTTIIAHIPTDAPAPLFLFLLMLSCITYLVIHYVKRS